MIIILRGHIRNSFDDNNLYNLLDYLSKKYTIEIYIHTYSIKQNNISWRKLDNDFSLIDDKIIFNYLKKLNKFIKKIIIDDENKIHLNGNLNGLIPSTKTYLFGWKRYVYSNYKILDFLYNSDIDKNQIIINTRFDLFTNLFIFPKDEIIAFIDNNHNKHFIKNIFLRDNEYCGIDNIILGNLETNYKLFLHLHTNLDKILEHEDIKTIIHPEFIVSRTNNLLF
jgi:hypothetical protein